MENKNPNKIDYTWDYKRRLKRDSIMLLISVVLAYIVYLHIILPRMEDWSFYEIYNMPNLGIIAFAVWIISIGMSIVAQNITFTQIWNPPYKRTIRLLALLIDIIMNYFFIKCILIIGWATYYWLGITCNN